MSLWREGVKKFGLDPGAHRPSLLGSQQDRDLIESPTEYGGGVGGAGQIRRPLLWSR